MKHEDIFKENKKKAKSTFSQKEMVEIFGTRSWDRVSGNSKPHGM